jgi:hypothetical protein
MLYQVDYLTQRLPINTTIRVFGFSDHAAELLIINIKDSNPEIALAIGDAIKVNGTGNRRLCASLETMLEILWMLPRNPKTMAFRSKCATDIVRQMKGDLAMIDELERNHRTLQDTGGLHFHEQGSGQVAWSEMHANTTTSGAMGAPPMSAEVARVTEEAHLDRMRLENEDRRAVIETRRVELEARRAELEDRRVAREERRERAVQELTVGHFDVLRQRREFLESMGMFGDCEAITVSDSIANYKPMSFGFAGATSGLLAVADTTGPVEEPAPGAAAVVGAGQVDNSPLQVSEIMELEMNIATDAVAKHSGTIGKLVAKEFRDRNGGDGAVFLEAIRKIHGCKRKVHAYSRANLVWIKELVDDYMAISGSVQQKRQKS